VKVLEDTRPVVTGFFDVTMIKKEAAERAGWQEAAVQGREVLGTLAAQVLSLGGHNQGQRGSHQGEGGPCHLQGACKDNPVEAAVDSPVAAAAGSADIPAGEGSQVAPQGSLGLGQVLPGAPLSREGTRGTQALLAHQAGPQGSRGILGRAYQQGGAEGLVLGRRLVVLLVLGKERGRGRASYGEQRCCLGWKREEGGPQQAGWRSWSLILAMERAGALPPLLLRWEGLLLEAPLPQEGTAREVAPSWVPGPG